jgi:aspartate racemase
MMTYDGITGTIRPVGEGGSAHETNGSAVFVDGRRVSLESVATHATRLSRQLRAAGVGPGMIVGIYLPRSVEFIAGLLAVLKTGAAFLPLEPSHPMDRTAQILGDAEPACLIAESPCPFPFGGKVVEVNRGPAADPATDDGDPQPEVALDSPAYVIYTSGTTGAPKGTVLTHRGLSSYMAALKDLNVTRDDVYLWTASQGFSSSVRQLVVPLCAGASVVVATAEDIADPIRLFRLIADQGVTIVDLVPSYWRMCTRVFETLRAEERDALLNNRVRLILSASEPLPADIPRRWRHDFGYRGEFVNGYGHTETTGLVSLHWMSDDVLRRREAVPIGPPLPGTTFEVLDEQHEPVPSGSIGELHVSGTSLARGYLNRPDLDAERFLPGPSGVPEDRRYRTGDLVQPLPDGTFRFVGRLDQQVKVNGVRVELEEVEAVLREHPAVYDAAVALREDGQDHKHLVAFLMAPEAQEPTVADIRAHMAARLPHVMIPGEFRIVASLPRTVSGKIDRAELKKLAAERPGVPSAVPAAGVETEVATQWRRILRLAAVDVTANFFELGGDSLKAMQLVAILQQRFPTEVPMLALFFEEPTVAALARAIQETLVRPAMPDAAAQPR